MPEKTNSAGRVPQRITVACTDDGHLMRALQRVQRAGASPFPLSTLAELAAAAERCDAVVIFADGFATKPLLACLHALEGRRSGPALIVVTDRTPTPWRPTLERDRPAVVITGSVWATSGLDLLRSGRAASIEAERSEPELPFTD